MSRPTVSVIIPFLNSEAFLAEAVESVFAQTYRHWEIVLVDDGSTDLSTAIALQLSMRHPDRIRYLTHGGYRNLGVSATRNLGMLNARGDLIAFLDADDVYLPERLAKHVEALERHPHADAVQSDTLRWYSWSDSDIADVRISWPFNVEEVVDAPEMLLRSLDFTPRDGWFPSTCGVTFRRSVLAEVGMFEMRFTVCEDWAFFTKLYLKKSVVILPLILAKYRKHASSALHKSQIDKGAIFSEHFHAHLAYLEWLEQFLVVGKAAPEMISRVRRQLWPASSRVTRMLGVPPGVKLALRMTSRRRLLKQTLPPSAVKHLRTLRRRWTEKPGRSGPPTMTRG